MEFQHELIIPNEGLPFKLFLFEGGAGNYVREKHWHTSVEIFAVLEGDLEFYVNTQEYPLHAGELIIINSNEIHSIRAENENKTVVLQIPLNQFEDYFTAQRYIRFRTGEQESASESGEGQLLCLIRNMYQSYMDKYPGYEFRTQSLYYEILYLLIRDYRQTEVHEKELRHSRRLDNLSKITTYMREHYREDLRLSQVASMFGYSDAYLSRMFQKYAKINFKSYLQEIRMAYAYRELMNTDHTISQIAMNNGFCSSRAFSREFLKRYGVLPSEMAGRKKARAKTKHQYH